MAKFNWDIEEEEKEEEKIIKFDWDKPIESIKPTQFGIGAKVEMGVTLPKPVEVPSSQFGISDVTPDLPESKAFQDPKMIELHKINFESFKLWFKELKESPDKIAFLTGEGQSPELQGLRKQYNELAPYMFGKSEQWISNVSMIAVGVGMVQQLSNTLVTSGFKVKDKVFSAKEIKEVLGRARAAYDFETGKFKATLSDNDFAVIKQINIFLKTTKRSPIAREMLEKIVEKTGGLSFPQQVNIFGGKLYAGIPIDEMVKSIVSAGKLTKDITNALKVMNPVDTGLVFQQLSIAWPALASKVASEFVELMPQKITKIPKVEEEMTPEEIEAFERLKVEKIIPIGEVEPTKVELEAIEKPEKVNPMAFSNDPLAISRELESYPDDSALIARKAELIFKQNIEGKEIDYPINIAKQELELAKNNLVEKFGNDYPEAEKIIKRAEILEKQLEKPIEKVVEIKKTKEFGYPPESYSFTGEYSEQFQGYYKATRNKKIVYAPIYENKEGKTVVDMEQVTTVKPSEAIIEKVLTPKEKIPKVEPKAPAIIGISVEYPIHYYVKSDVTGKFPNAKTFKKNIEKARKVFVADKELDDLSNYNIEKEFGSLENYYNWVKENKTKIKSVEEQYNKFIDRLPIEDKLKKVWKKDPENFELNYERLKVEPKPPVEPTIPGLTEKEFVPATIEEAKEILKVDPKEPSVPKIKLAEEMVKKKISLADIEAVKGEKIDVKKPRDIIVALRDIKAVKKEVVAKEELKAEVKHVELKPGEKVTREYLDRVAGLEKKEETPKVEIKKPEIGLATPKQIKKAHAIANTKALISEKGKVKPQYRRIAEAMTGKKSTKDMNPEEAEMFIDALERLPEPKYKAGKLVAPSIPRIMKLTTEGFFQKKYGEPTPIWLLTDQTYYATKLGIHPLVEPFEKGKQEFDLEFRQSSHLVDRMVNKLNTVAKTSAFAKIKSKVKNIPTKAENKMAELINKHEATPSGLTEKEKDIFKYFRNLGKDIWRRENEVREKVDLPPIKYKQAYFRHTADVMAKEMLEGKYPFPQGIKYWGEKMVGKKIFNPMEFHRKLSDELIDIWSKDIRAVTKAMLWSGLKEIYLAQPAKFLNEQLNAISKDLPEYRNLSPRDQAAYDQTRVMPASTKKWLVNYVNQVLKGQETELDASLNRIVTKSGLKGIFDKVLSPFGRTIGRKPITNIFMLSGRAVISGVMGWVPRQIMRNSFQPVQNLALYGIKATIKAYLPASVDKNLKELMSESLFLKSYTGFEELPTNLMGKLEKVWLGPYGIVAVNNAKLGMKAAYWNTIELIRNPKFKKHGWADSQRTKDTPKGLLYTSEKEKLSREMEFGASATQYQYIPMGMPGVFRYKALVPLTRLQSWWMNYFTKFNREALHRAFKGRPSWSGEDGPTLPWSRRVNYLKYLIIGGSILTALGYRKSFMLGVAPVYLSPAGQVALGMYNYATATEDWQKKRALRQIYYSWKAFIPGSLAWRDFLAVWKGEKELNEILWYAKKEEKLKGKPVPTVKFDWDKTIKPTKVIKFDWD